MLAMQLQSLLDVGFVCGHIGRIFDAWRRVYSAPPIHAELRREGRRQACRRIQSMSRRGIAWKSTLASRALGPSSSEDGLIAW